MKRTSVAVTTVLAVLLAASPAAAGVDTAIGFMTLPEDIHADRDWSSLDEVRLATGQYHELSNALANGFVPFAVGGGDSPTCFDGAGGGMGVHYVRNVDGVVDAVDPEALVYELTESGQPRLVGVEYVVPQEFVEDANGDAVDLPALFGRDFHKHASLPLYVLHAWVWEENPDGMFADLNPAVSACRANLALQ